jgi:hypothetical protein
MTDVRSFYEKDYVGAWDIPPDRDVAVVIDRVVPGKIPQMGSDKKKGKALVYFRGKKKPMVAGATVRDTIAKVVGSYEDSDWAGKAILLYRSKTSRAGEEVDCVRVRPFAPKASSQPIAADAPETTEREAGEEEPGS